jgi:hypothetical protein
MTTEVPKLTIDAAIKTYLVLRRQKEGIEAETKATVDELKTKMGKIESWLQAKADEAGVTSFKTEVGTAFLTSADFASVADWDAMLDYVTRNKAYDLLERRVSRSAVRGYIDSTGQVPDGVNYGTKVSVNVRKPTKKAD